MGPSPVFVRRLSPFSSRAAYRLQSKTAYNTPVRCAGDPHVIFEGHNMPQLESNAIASRRAARRSSAGWQRGRSSATGSPPRWRTSKAHVGSPGRGLRMPRRRRIGVGLFLILFFVSAALLIYYLILLPTKTPLVAAVAVDYHWPLPPNAWAREDLDSLKSALDGQTFSIRDVALSGSSIEKLVEQIEIAGRRAPPTGAVLVYLSAHAAVDGQGQPCLVLPHADPVDSGTWLPLSQLLEQLKAIEQRRGSRHLLVLDCSRQRENLSLGLLDNRFAEGLAAAVKKAARARVGRAEFGLVGTDRMGIEPVTRLGIRMLPASGRRRRRGSRSGRERLAPRSAPVPPAACRCLGTRPSRRSAITHALSSRRTGLPGRLVAQFTRSSQAQRGSREAGDKAAFRPANGLRGCGSCTIESWRSGRRILLRSSGRRSSISSCGSTRRRSPVKPINRRSTN